MRTLVIAEPGGTHGGKLDAMIRLVDTAADCGADVFKSEWTSSAQAMCDRRHAPEYLDSYRLLEYPIEWHRVLSLAAHERGMEYACTAYLPGDPTRLASFVDYLKISSFEAEDRALFKEARKAAGPDRLIISFGMGARVSANHSRCLRLACVSAYPTPLDALNLRVLGDLSGEEGGEYPTFDGFSDHSHDVRVGAWAVCAGARIVETHFRLDDCDPANKDYAVAFTPAEFKTYVQNVRDCEAALGDGQKRIMDAEQPMLRYRVMG